MGALGPNIRTLLWIVRPLLVLPLIGGLNAAAEARYERGRDPIDGPTARLIGHDGGLVNGNEDVVVSGRKFSR